MPTTEFSTLSHASPNTHDYTPRKIDALGGSHSRTAAVPVPTSVTGSPPTATLSTLSGSPPTSSSFGISPPNSLLQRAPGPVPTAAAPSNQDREKVLYPQRVILTSEFFYYTHPRELR